MIAEQVWANARVVTGHEAFVGSVCARDGRIVEIERGPNVPAGALDCEGDDLLPGLVELHTDVLEKHAFPRPGVTWPTVAAAIAHDAQLATAGITTVLDGLAVGYLVDTGQRAFDPRPLADAVRTAQDAGLLRITHYVHLRCEVSVQGVLEMFEPFVGDRLVRLVSLMDHTPGQRQFVRLDKYREYYKGKWGMSDAEIDATIERRRHDHARFAAIHRNAITRACAGQGTPLASHDDATLAHVEEAAKAGVVVAEFPTTLEAARACRAYGLAVLAGGPNLVLGASHSGNVAVADLAVEGLVDIISSDYVPASALHGAYRLHHVHGLTLPAAITAVSRTPAERVGLHDRGEIAVGKRADLVRVRASDDVPVVGAVWVAGTRVA
jgi:alpha-D-ribose 1-methylphosphonate 5-triphosphate diphosphatase